MVHKKWYFSSIIALALLGVGCKTIQKHTQKNLDTHKTQTIDSTTKHQAPTITIWVHGTTLFGSKILPNFFYCQRGLHRACSLDKRYHHRIMAEILAEADPQHFSLKNFYLFGWAGSLSFEARKQAAQELYGSLKKLSDMHEKLYHQTPNIRIITHSHGGNVALNLANVKDAKNNITISELILLACPVQDYTKRTIQDPIFKRVVSLYSTLDALQVLDPQGMYSKEVHEMHKHYEKYTKTPLFSQRVFEPHAKIVQAKLKINGRGIFHIEFLMNKFLRELPKILDRLHEYTKEKDTIGSKTLLLNITNNKPIQVRMI